MAGKKMTEWVLWVHDFSCTETAQSAESAAHLSAIYFHCLTVLVCLCACRWFSYMWYLYVCESYEVFITCFDVGNS